MMKYKCILSVPGIHCIRWPKIPISYGEEKTISEGRFGRILRCDGNTQSLT